MGKFLLSLGLLFAFAACSAAAPINYAFDYSDSDVGFIYEFDGQQFRGKFPDFSGELVIDFQKVANSKVSVTIDTTTAQGGFIFATGALRGPRVLAVDRYPEMRFVSRSAQLEGNGAIVTGDLTVRGVTRPVQLQVTVLRDAGTEPSERDNLILRAQTSLRRSEFHADGYNDLVSDTLNIDIRARIRRIK